MYTPTPKVHTGGAKKPFRKRISVLSLAASSSELAGSSEFGRLWSATGTVLATVELKDITGTISPIE
jgi:hypothetical protein